MGGGAKPPAAGFKFNAFQEIKSHSSILYNERMAILFYHLDFRAIAMNTYYRVDDVLRVRAILKQIYKNVRMLIRTNPTVRSSLNLETKDEGTYVTDLAFTVVDNLVLYCEQNDYTPQKLYILAEQLNRVEMLLKDVLQYFSYFIRPAFKQKPDVDRATDDYKRISDDRTIEQLREFVGKNHKIDFEDLGKTVVQLEDDIEYDSVVDGDPDDIPQLNDAYAETDDEGRPKLLSSEEAEEVSEDML